MFRRIYTALIPHVRYVANSATRAGGPEELVLKARSYLRHHDFKQAISSCTKAMKIDPTYVAAYAVRGECYEAIGDLNTALRDYTKVTLLKPEYLPAYATIAQCHAALGDIDEAIQHYDYILAADTKYVPALGGRAELLLAKGELKDADRDYAAVLEQEPTNLSALLGRARITLEIGQLALAMKLLAFTTRSHPDCTAAHVLLGVALMSQEQFTEAIAAFDRALTLDAKEQGSGAESSALLFEDGETEDIERSAVGETAAAPAQAEPVGLAKATAPEASNVVHRASTGKQQRTLSGSSVIEVDGGTAEIREEPSSAPKAAAAAGAATAQQSKYVREIDPSLAPELPREGEVTSVSTLEDDGRATTQARAHMYFPRYDLLCKRALALMMSGRHTEAVASATAALELQPAYYMASLVRAQSRTALGQMQEAVTDYTAFIEGMQAALAGVASAPEEQQQLMDARLHRAQCRLHVLKDVLSVTPPEDLSPAYRAAARALDAPGHTAEKATAIAEVLGRASKHDQVSALARLVIGDVVREAADRRDEQLKVLEDLFRQMQAQPQLSQ